MITMVEDETFNNGDYVIMWEDDKDHIHFDTSTEIIINCDPSEKLLYI